MAVQPPGLAQGVETRDHGLPTFDDLRTHVKPQAPQRDGRPQPLGVILRACGEVRASP